MAVSTWYTAILRISNYSIHTHKKPIYLLKSKGHHMKLLILYIIYGEIIKFFTKQWWVWNSPTYDYLFTAKCPHPYWVSSSQLFVLSPYTQGQGVSMESSAQPYPSASSQAKEYFPGTDMQTAELCPAAAQLLPMMLWLFACKAKMFWIEIRVGLNWIFK